MDAVYLETSIFGYPASRMSSDLVTAGNQLLTQEWWDNHRESFDLFISQAVVAECSAGDPDAANERLVFLADLPILDITDEAKVLAESLLSDIPLPENAEVDALHIAVAAVNGMDYLLRWNCKHIANPSLRRIIDEVLLAADVSPPIICTPQELINV
jgi:hypothetical protein